MAVFLSVTVALGTTAPLGSVIVPVRSPETSDCAINDGIKIAVITRKVRISLISLLVVIATYFSLSIGITKSFAVPGVSSPPYEPISAALLGHLTCRKQVAFLRGRIEPQYRLVGMRSV